MGEVTGKLKRPHRLPCECPVCTVSRALRDLDGATNAWVEREAEQEMRLAWLRSEVAAVVRSPLSLLVRRRLRKALEVAS